MHHANVNHALEARARLSLNGLMTAFTGELEALLGFKPDDFLSGRISLKQRIHRDDLDLADRLFSIDPHSGSCNLRLRHADGRIRCLKAYFTKEVGAEGLLLDLSLQDAKCLHRIDPTMMVNFRAMMETTEDYITFKDRNHVFTGASQTLVSLCEPVAHWHDLLGQTDYDVFAEEYADLHYRLEKQVYASAGVAHEIQPTLTRDGRPGWVDNRKYPIRNETGEIIGLFGIARDISERKQVEATLRRERDLNRQYLDTTQTLMFALDPAGCITMINRAGCELLGYAQEELLGKNWFTTCLPAAVAEHDVLPLYHKIMAGGIESVEYHENSVLCRDGSERMIAWHNRILSDEQGRIIGLITSGEDITLRRQAEEKLHLAASVFTHAREGIMITTADATIIDVNDTFSHITGYSREEAIGQNPRILRSGRQGAQFYATLWHSLIEEGHWNGEIWNRHKNGLEYAEILTISAVRNDQGRIERYVALFSDITSMKEYERQLEHIAHYDALTGLHNRVLLADRLNQAMTQTHRHRQMLAVAYLDLDGFKAINDRHGHAIGDQLLKIVAGRMKQTLREVDTLARLGGDEFVAVLLDLANVEASRTMLERLLEAAAQPVRIGALSLQVSASIGVTFYPQAEQLNLDPDQLLRQADQAMYQAKQAGKNRYHWFDTALELSVRGHHESMKRIRQALIGREFVLHYQPKVNMRTGVVIGTEALIRWQHPQRGLLAPATFLPAIENHPLAIELGEWVIDTALTQLGNWQAAGLHLPISVNISAFHLQQADFVERLHLLLAAHPEVKASSLELEVLETSALQDLAHTSQVIQACLEVGVSFSLDDFGTGYSSLTYLKHLPTATLKIDQSFVRDMLSDPDDLAILEGVLGLATAFRRRAIAEGVETVEHGELLLQLGCEFAQGYCIARPMPAADLPGWAATWRPDPVWTHVRSVSRDDMPMLYAGVEHRAWIVSLEACLESRAMTTPPPLDPHKCRFGIWLDAERLTERGVHPGISVIDSLHKKIHGLAEEICELQAQARSLDGLARMDEIHGLHDAMIEQLKKLMQKYQQGSLDEIVCANFVRLIWHASYECGVDTIDRQHRDLFNHINDLLMAALSGRPGSEIAALIDVLIGDVVQHFHDEEAIFTAAKFPGASEHVAIHRDLVHQASALIGHFHAGTLGIGELFQFLAQEVVARHMLGEDRKFFSSLA